MPRDAARAHQSRPPLHRTRSHSRSRMRGYGPAPLPSAERNADRNTRGTEENVVAATETIVFLSRGAHAGARRCGAHQANPPLRLDRRAGPRSQTGNLTSAVHLGQVSRADRTCTCKLSFRSLGSEFKLCDPEVATLKAASSGTVRPHLTRKRFTCRSLQSGRLQKCSI